MDCRNRTLLALVSVVALVACSAPSPTDSTVVTDDPDAQPRDREPPPDVPEPEDISALDGSIVQQPPPDANAPDVRPPPRDVPVIDAPPPPPRDVVTIVDTPPPPRDIPIVMDVAPPDWCAARANGSYCDGRSVHTCTSNRTTRIEPCADGCYERGATSVCASDAVDPCFNDPDGTYCGSSIGATARVNDVYVCRGRRTARIDVCAMGCEGTFGMARCRVAMADPCERATSGDGLYCGASLGAGDTNTLYDCRSRRTSSAMVCTHGCMVRPPGMPDACNPPPSTGGAGYRLPLGCGTRASVSQGNNTSFSHNGTQAWAYDFSVARGTPVMAMEAGTVTHANSSVVSGGACWNGGGSECANTVNYVVLSHSDGTSTLYLHLDAAEVAVGARVTRGQRIARSGNTGWSTGAHLHVQRQARCGSWFCASQSLTFMDVGMPATGATVTSGNCP